MGLREQILGRTQPLPSKVRRGPLIKANVTLSREHAALFERVAADIARDRRDIFDALTPDEQQTVISYLANAVVDRDYAQVMRDLLWEIDFRHRPVDIDTFLTDPYYFGSTCADMHQVWRQDLRQVFAPGSRVYELILTGAIGTGKCVVAGTLIPTARGMVPIEEVTVADQVHARTGLCPVTTVHDEGITRVLQVETKHGHVLSGRPNHRVLALVGLTPAWVALQDLKEGDCLLQQPTPEAWGPATMSPQAGELLGWIVAEGSQGGYNYYQLSLADSEIQYVAALANTVGNELGITSVRVYPHFRRVDITSPTLVALLKGARSWEKTIPAPVLCGGLPALHGFLRGLFSGDGSIDHIGCCELSTASERLAQQVRTVFTALGLTVLVTAKAMQYTYQGEVREGRTAYRVRLVGPETDRYFCDNIGFVREDQQQKIQARTERYSRNTDHSFTHRVPATCVDALREAQPYYCKGSCPLGQSKTKTPRGKLGRLLVQGATRRLWREILDAGGVLPEALTQVAQGDLLFDTVTTVLEGHAHCYDLTVEGDPSYVSNGFISHNTTIACAALGYKLYWMSCLRDPASYYGLLPNSLIIFGIYSITKKQVGDAGYYKMRSYIDGSPYFRREYPRNMRIDSKIVFKNANVQVVPGSRELHALGLDLYGYLLDEVNFMHASLDPETGRMLGQAYDLYHATHRRLMSRFMRPGGVIPGFMALISSRKHETAFLEEHMKGVKARMGRDASGAAKAMSYICDYPLWHCKPPHRFTLPTFRVQVGDRYVRSRILADKEQVPRGVRVVEKVPGEFRRAFEENVDEALRDIAGVATFNVSPLICDRQSILDAYRPHLTHPFRDLVAYASTADKTLLEEQFILSAACRIENGKWTPRINPKAPRYLHLDMSETGDCSGVAMGHCAGLVRLRKPRPDGTTHVIMYPYTVYDFMLRVPPPRDGGIALWKLRSFVLWLSKIFRIALVSTDGWNSVEMRQLLDTEGIKAVLLSVDRSTDPYLALRTAYFERRVAQYAYPPFEVEILDLLYDLKADKVDHPQTSSNGGKGTKDVADAVCGVHSHCMREARFATKLDVVEDRDVADYVPYAADVPAGTDASDLPLETRIPGGAEALAQQARMDRPQPPPTLTGVPGATWTDLERNLEDGRHGG